jgi:hypothetical protein
LLCREGRDAEGRGDECQRSDERVGRSNQIECVSLSKNRGELGLRVPAFLADSNVRGNDLGLQRNG